MLAKSTIPIITKKNKQETKAMYKGVGKCCAMLCYTVLCNIDNNKALKREGLANIPTNTQTTKKNL